MLPSWAMPVIEWAIGELLKKLDGPEAKKILANLLTAIDGAVQAADARVTGPFKGVADETAAAFHNAIDAITKSLTT